MVKMLKKFIDIVFGVALVFQSVVLLDYLLDLIPIFYETVFNIQRSLYLGIKFVLLKALHFLAPVFQLLNLAFQFLRLWVLTCLQYFGIALNFVGWANVYCDITGSDIRRSRIAVVSVIIATHNKCGDDL
jgi:hypothetical protein